MSFGLKKRMTIVLAWASGLEQFEALGADLCEGVYSALSIGTASIHP